MTQGSLLFIPDSNTVMYVCTYSHEMSNDMHTPKSCKRKHVQCGKNNTGDNDINYCHLVTTVQKVLVTGNCNVMNVVFITSYIIIN